MQQNIYNHARVPGQIRGVAVAGGSGETAGSNSQQSFVTLSDC